MRWRAYNVETLTTHISSYERIALNRKFPPERICNLDESGVPQNRDVHAKLNQKKVVDALSRTTRANAEQRFSTFKKVDFVKLMPVIFENSSHGPTLFIT